MELRSRGPNIGYELYRRKQAKKQDAPVVQCSGDCTASVTRGDYVLVVSPSDETRLGRRSVTIDGPTRLEVEPASSSSRWVGLALATASIPLTLGGIGLAGGAAVDGSPDRRGLFWLGTGGTVLGLGAMFAGWALYAGKPRVDTLPQSGRSDRVVAPRYDAPAPMMPDEHSPKEDERATAPYRTEDRPGQGLIVTGSIMFGASYGLMLLVAAADAAGAGNDTQDNDELAIPVVGPLFVGDTEERSALALYGTAPQVAGLALLLVGLGAYTEVWVRDWRQSGWSLTPIVTQRSAALGLERSW